MDFVLKLKADYLKALANPSRLRIIEALKNGESQVGGMGQRLQIEQSVLSKHLLLMKSAGILSSRQQGTTVYYKIKDPKVHQLLGIVSRSLASRMIEGQKVLAQLRRSAPRGKG